VPERGTFQPVLFQSKRKQAGDQSSKGERKSGGFPVLPLGRIRVNLLAVAERGKRKRGRQCSFTFRPGTVGKKEREVGGLSKSNDLPQLVKKKRSRRVLLLSKHGGKKTKRKCGSLSSGWVSRDNIWGKRKRRRGMVGRLGTQFLIVKGPEHPQASRPGWRKRKRKEG